MSGRLRWCYGSCTATRSRMADSRPTRRSAIPLSNQPGPFVLVTLPIRLPPSAIFVAFSPSAPETAQGGTASASSNGALGVLMRTQKTTLYPLCTTGDCVPGQRRAAPEAATLPGGPLRRHARVLAGAAGRPPGVCRANRQDCGRQTVAATISSPRAPTTNATSIGVLGSERMRRGIRPGRGGGAGDEARGRERCCRRK